MRRVINLLGLEVEPHGMDAPPGHASLTDRVGATLTGLGDVACFPAGADGAHAFRNDGDVTARFAMPSAGPLHIDACVYPDSGKIKVTGRGFGRRFDLGPERDYWERES